MNHFELTDEQLEKVVGGTAANYANQVNYAFAPPGFKILSHLASTSINSVVLFTSQMELCSQLSTSQKFLSSRTPLVQSLLQRTMKWGEGSSKGELPPRVYQTNAQVCYS